MALCQPLNSSSFLALAALLTGFCLGCGGPSAPPPLEGTDISGLVTLKGEPVAVNQLRFIPISPTKGFGATVFTDAEGRYKIDSSTTPGSNGLPEGNYKVLVEPYKPPEDPELAKKFPAPEGKPTAIPSLFAFEDRSPVQVNVVKGAKTLDIELTTAK